jgi:hypothetical protein
LSASPSLADAIDTIIDAVADRVVSRFGGGPTPLGASAAVAHAVSPNYDSATCDVYVGRLGDGVLPRAEVMFAEMDAQGQVGSAALVQKLRLKSARSIPANLTNSLKQSAAALGLPEPWDEGTGTDNRTVWIARGGIPVRMVAALRKERARRANP